MIDILPYKKELLENFIYDGVEKEFSGTQILPMVEFYSKLGDIFVGKIENKILGVGGLYPLWEKSGGCFLFLNKEAQNYKVSVFKVLLKYMNMLIKKYQIKILTVECIDGNLQAKNLITHLGFIKSKEIKMSFFIKQEKV